MTNGNTSAEQSPVPDQSDQQATPPASPVQPEQSTPPIEGKKSSKKWLWILIVLILIAVGIGLYFWLRIAPIEYPNEVEAYTLKEVPTISKDCRPVNQLGPIMGGIDIEDTVCIEGATFEYVNKNDDPSNKRGLFLTISRFDKGKDVYKNSVLKFLRPTNIEGVYRKGEGWELYWWSDNFYIIVQEFVQKPDESGGHSYSYSSTATIQHPITNWFITKYPPPSDTD